MITKTQAQENLKKLSTEASSLNPSALVTLFEIDLGALADSRNIQIDESNRIFRFHNNLKLINTDIIFQGNKYVLAPIESEGYEIKSNGTLPTPILRMSVIDQVSNLFAIIKQSVRNFGDLIGCKVTRRRTFARFLNNVNFNDQNRPNELESNDFIEFPPDIYYINRKTRENKLVIEYELVSSLDLEGIMIPRRLVISKRCNFIYRGEGCNYEYNERRKPDIYIDDVHGEEAILPIEAPAVATAEDKLIKDELGVPSIEDKGVYSPTQQYVRGQSVFITKDGINYYFVARSTVTGISPTNSAYWIADSCSKCIKGCKIRWNNTNPVGSVVVSSPLVKGKLPYGGFYGTERLRGKGY